MRKERRRKQQNRSYSRPVGVVCLLMGLLFAAALLMTAEDGVMHYAYLVEQHLLGKGIFLLPLAFFAASFALLKGQFGVFNKRTLIFTLVTLCLTGTAHHVFVPVGSELEPSLIAEGGGLIGGLLLKLLRSFAGDVTVYVILALGWLWLLGLVLPLRKWWELWQDYLTSDEITLVRPDDKVREERVRPEPAVRAVFKRKSAAPQQHAAPADNVISNYTSPEFDAFNEGVQKKSAFRSILGFTKNKSVYEKSPLKEEIERDPVQLPEWEQSKPEVIVRPIINYDDDYEPDSRFLDDAEPQAAEPEPEPERPASVIRNTYREEQAAAFAAPAKAEPQPEPELEKSAVTILTARIKLPQRRLLRRLQQHMSLKRRPRAAISCPRWSFWIRRRPVTRPPIRRTSWTNVRCWSRLWQTSRCAPELLP